MTGREDRAAERLRRAERLVEAAGAGPPPYPSREATGFADALGLAVYELLTDPAWIAENWLPRDGDGHVHGHGGDEQEEEHGGG